MSAKTRHVLGKLPQQAFAVRERMIVDRDFRSLCEDYGEAFEALRRWQVSDDRRRHERVEEYQELLRDLERDILRKLSAGFR
jgi:hypothetical protein